MFTWPRLALRTVPGIETPPKDMPPHHKNSKRRNGPPSGQALMPWCRVQPSLFSVFSLLFCRLSMYSSIASSLGARTSLAWSQHTSTILLGGTCCCQGVSLGVSPTLLCLAIPTWRGRARGIFTTSECLWRGRFDRRGCRHTRRCTQRRACLRPPPARLCSLGHARRRRASCPYATVADGGVGAAESPCACSSPSALRGEVRAAARRVVAPSADPLIGVWRGMSLAPPPGGMFFAPPRCQKSLYSACRAALPAFMARGRAACSQYRRALARKTRQRSLRPRERRRQIVRSASIGDTLSRI